MEKQQNAAGTIVFIPRPAGQPFMLLDTRDGSLWEATEARGWAKVDNGPFGEPFEDPQCKELIECGKLIESQKAEITRLKLRAATDETIELARLQGGEE
jgi:hypothetical protein